MQSLIEHYTVVVAIIAISTYAGVMIARNGSWWLMNKTHNCVPGMIAYAMLINPFFMGWIDAIASSDLATALFCFYTVLPLTVMLVYFAQVYNSSFRSIALTGLSLFALLFAHLQYGTAGATAALSVWVFLAWILSAQGKAVLEKLRPAATAS